MNKKTKINLLSGIFSLPAKTFHHVIEKMSYITKWFLEPDQNLKLGPQVASKKRKQKHEILKSKIQEEYSRLNKIHPRSALAIARIINRNNEFKDIKIERIQKIILQIKKEI